jgi:tRNA threonylcarbamoyladenosine biosynthesis protein TsaB
VLILAVDTSSPHGSLAVLRDENLIGVVSTHADETYSSRMFRHLEFLLRDLSLELNQFDLFAVDAGPGSFTGLRVGLTAAKGWAEVHKKPAAAVSGLEAVAFQSRSAAPILVPVLDARRGQFYFAFYRSTLGGRALDGEDCVASPEEFIDMLKAKARNSSFCIVTVDRNLVTGSLSQIESNRGELEMVSPVLAPSIGSIGYARAQRGQLSDALSLDANYVRRSDAELHWKTP